MKNVLKTLQVLLNIIPSIIDIVENIKATFSRDKSINMDEK